MSLNLYQEMRPENYDQVIGQDKTVSILKKHSKEKKMRQTIFLGGPSGVGKTTLARLIGKSILCGNLKEDGNPCNECEYCNDINKEEFNFGYEEKSGSNIGIEQMRKICADLESPSVLSPVKILFIDELQESSIKAIKDLLDTTEKKKTRSYIILGTMDPSIIPAALGDRTFLFRLNSIPPETIFKYMAGVCKLKNIDLGSDNKKIEVLSTIVDYSEGSLRGALSKLEVCIEGDIWTPEELQKYLSLSSIENLSNIIKSLCKGDLSILDKLSVDQKNIGLFRWLVVQGYKRVNGVKLNYWGNKQTTNLIGLNPNALNNIIIEMGEILKYNHFNQDIIEYHLLRSAIENKKLNPVNSGRQKING